MARIMCSILNSLEQDLQFTSEVPGYFNSGTLPTLDFQIWVQDEEVETIRPPSTGPSTTSPDTSATCQVIKYKFFEKEMGAQVVMLESSAASWQSKVSSLTQEVTRRLLNTCWDLKEEKKEILNTYSRKLRRSGYSNKQVVGIITSGVVGHARRHTKLGKEHRESWESADERELRRLTVKSTGFKSGKQVA